MSQRDDDEGQVDGDASASAWYGGAGFAQANGMQPWLRNIGEPPWHLWGNQQRITTKVETVGEIRFGVTNQLVKLAYKRPETWHWLFSARLISGPENTATFFSRVFVHWELATGLGRSSVLMKQGSETGDYGQPAFDTFSFQWGPTLPRFPRGAHIWATTASAPSKIFAGDGPFTLATDGVDQIVAQDLQLNATVVALTVADNVAAVGQPVVVEVSAFFAPKTHIRPEWLHPTAPIEQIFPGDEIGGR